MHTICNSKMIFRNSCLCYHLFMNSFVNIEHKATNQTRVLAFLCIRKASGCILQGLGLTNIAVSCLFMPIVSFLAYEPYQREKPDYVKAYTLSQNAMVVRWRDPGLQDDQKIRDSRFYTVRYYSYDLGGYQYLNVTDLSAQIDTLQPDTEYNFEVRVMDPPYRSHWSEAARNRTSAIRGKDCYH